MERGTPFALAHTFRQTGPFRPRNVDPRVPGLVFVGSSTVPGVGVPMVLVSGRLAAAGAARCGIGGYPAEGVLRLPARRRRRRWSPSRSPSTLGRWRPPSPHLRRRRSFHDDDLAAAACRVAGRSAAGRHGRWGELATTMVGRVGSARASRRLVRRTSSTLASRVAWPSGRGMPVVVPLCVAGDGRAGAGGGVGGGGRADIVESPGGIASRAVATSRRGTCSSIRR